MWSNFNPTPYSREQYLAYVASLPLAKFGWVKGLRLHNTGSPTLEDWMSYPEVQRLLNLQRYYQVTMGWHAGPHGFNGPVHLNGFSDITKPGVQCSCGNSEELGFESVGNYVPGGDAWDSGPGAQVRDNTILCFATWFRKLGLDPDDLRFHRDCEKDHHACPGSLVQKPDTISRIKAQMTALQAGRIDLPQIVVPTSVAVVQPSSHPATAHTTAWLQQALDSAAKAGLRVDGVMGPLTKAAIAAFQKAHGLLADGVPGPDTTRALEKATAAKAA